jgi:uncharacterized protein
MSLVIKWLLVVIVVGLGYHWWRSNRASLTQKEDPIPQKPPSSRIREMATCRYCGLHADRDDMVEGKRGVYCTDDHRRAQADERS